MIGTAIGSGAGHERAVHGARGEAWPALPAIDYAAHPAYAAPAKASRTLRIRALRIFARGFIIAFARWLLDAEHLPKPPAGAGRARSFARRLPAAARAVLRSWRFRAFPRRTWSLSAAGGECRERLGRDGLMTFGMSAAEHSAAMQLLAPHFASLERRLVAAAPDAMHFDDNRYWIDPAADPAAYAWFEEMLERRGVLSGSSAWLRRPVRVAHLVPQLNRPDNDFWSGRFADLAMDDPACNYCHVDTAHNTTKMIIYLNEVGAENGPFSFVPGSHRARRSFADRLIRRAIDHSGLAASDPETRALFASLPAVLRRKGAFGQDLEDGHPAAAQILTHERTIMSDEADCILFDPEGIHRGGMIRAGERRIVGVVLADRAV